MNDQTEAPETTEADEFDQMADRARRIMRDAGRELTELELSVLNGSMSYLARRFSELEDAVMFAQRLIDASRDLAEALRDIQAQQFDHIQAAVSRMGAGPMDAEVVERVPMDRETAELEARRARVRDGNARF